MNIQQAQAIGQKTRALKHCTKLLDQIDKTGEVSVKLNCTGVTFIVHKNDGMYLRIATTKAQLLEEIAAYEVIKGKKNSDENPPAAVSEAKPVQTEEEEAAVRKQKKREYMRGYNARKRAAALAAATT